MGADVTSDGYYAIVPEWVLDAGVSGNAVKLYALLRRYADKASGEAHPSRRTLAARMGFQRTASVDPIITELIDAGAVCTFERWTEHGDRDSNGYHVKSVRPVGVVRSTAPQVVRGSGPGVVRETVQQEPQSVEPQSLEPQTLLLVPDGKSSNDDFDAFYFAYPRKVGKQAAAKAWAKAIKTTPAQRIIDAARKFAADPNLPEKQYIPHPTSWLNAGRWDDEQLPARDGGGGRLPPELEGLLNR
jgi:hypothetical protein